MPVSGGSASLQGKGVHAGRLIRTQLFNLLKIIDLEKDGLPVRPDSAVFRSGGAAEDGPVTAAPVSLHPKRIKFDSLKSYIGEEPRLAMIGNLLARMRRLVDLEKDGERVNADGFRLKNLAFWARYPTGSIIDNFGRIASWCSCDCEFCFLKGAPQKDHKVILSLDEARTRGKYFSSSGRRGLPTPLRWNGEPFVNPRIMEILEIARAAQPGRILEVTTNGDFLKEEVIERLAELKPVTVVLSLNSADVDTRQRIMKTKHAARAVHAVPKLRERGIRFLGSIVTWPDLPNDDIEATVRFLDEHRALQIRFLLPGYTRFRSETPLFDTEACWGRAVETARKLRREIRTPIVIQPGYYWNRDIRSFIDGVYRNSPAERAGLRFGDLILDIDGEPVETKAEAAKLLSRTKRANGLWKRSVTVQRNGETFTAVLEDKSSLEDDLYPFKPKGYPLVRRSRGGIHLIDGFRMEYLERLKVCAAKRTGVRRAVVFTTRLSEALFEQARTISGDGAGILNEGIEWKIVTTPHRFWGGNIMIGDINVVDDYVDRLLKVEEEGFRPDLALIPSSFASRWGFDVLGRSYREIERRTGVRVELVPTVRVVV